MPDKGDEYEGDVTRCVCGFTWDDGYMVACSKCDVWAHVSCHYPNKTKEEVEQMDYVCERCEPRPVDRERARNIQLEKQRNGELEDMHGETGPEMEEVKKEKAKRSGSANSTRQRNRNGKTRKPGNGAAGEGSTPQRIRGDTFERLDESVYTDTARTFIASLSNAGSNTSMKMEKMPKSKDCRVESAQEPGKRKTLVVVEPADVGDLIIEYKGLVMTSEEATTDSGRSKSPYVLQVPKIQICIDAREKGNDARFINKSQEPNCEVKDVLIGGSLRVGVFCTRPIAGGNEITIPHFRSTTVRKRNLQSVSRQSSNVPPSDTPAKKGKAEGQSSPLAIFAVADRKATAVAGRAASTVGVASNNTMPGAADEARTSNTGRAGQTAQQQHRGLARATSRSTHATGKGTGSPASGQGSHSPARASVQLGQAEFSKHSAYDEGGDVASLGDMGSLSSRDKKKLEAQIKAFQRLEDSKSRRPSVNSSDDLMRQVEPGRKAPATTMQSLSDRYHQHMAKENREEEEQYLSFKTSLKISVPPRDHEVKVIPLVAPKKSDDLAKSGPREGNNNNRTKKLHKGKKQWMLEMVAMEQDTEEESVPIPSNGLPNSVSTSTSLPSSIKSHAAPLIPKPPAVSNESNPQSRLPGNDHGAAPEATMMQAPPLPLGGHGSDTVAANTNTDTIDDDGVPMELDDDDEVTEAPIIVERAVQHAREDGVFASLGADTTKGVAKAASSEVATSKTVSPLRASQSSSNSNSNNSRYQAGNQIMNEEPHSNSAAASNQLPPKRQIMQSVGKQSPLSRTLSSSSGDTQGMSETTAMNATESGGDSSLAGPDTEDGAAKAENNAASSAAIKPVAKRVSLSDYKKRRISTQPTGVQSKDGSHMDPIPGSPLVTGNRSQVGSSRLGASDLKRELHSDARGSAATKPAQVPATASGSGMHGQSHPSAAVMLTGGGAYREHNNSSNPRSVSQRNSYDSAIGRDEMDSFGGDGGGMGRNEETSSPRPFKGERYNNAPPSDRVIIGGANRSSAYIEWERQHQQAVLRAKLAGPNGAVPGAGAGDNEPPDVRHLNRDTRAIYDTQYDARRDYAPMDYDQRDYEMGRDRDRGRPHVAGGWREHQNSNGDFPPRAAYDRGGVGGGGREGRAGSAWRDVDRRAAYQQRGGIR